MTALNKQALREVANAANIASWGKWESYKPHKGARGYEVKVGAKAVAQHCLKVDSAFIAAANPATVLSLLDENYSLTAERDALRENIGGDNTRNAADIYFQLVEECEIPPGGSLVGYIDDIKERLSNAENHSSELDNALCELLPGTHYMDPPDGGSVTPLEQVRRMVADYRERIEELESRAVCLPKLPVLGSNSEWYEGFAAGTSGMRNECADAIRAAGIGVKGECKGGACE
ncbi:ead/Ea22-like family protein [Citrobacter sp. Ce105]|uniref:ead/Ea22-like family protein n=1 Tax=Citrobacter sp. Ce105 TaxID=2985041 RepID=UPI0025776C92|nr:ead/Ea22-like family protein [Citrobacter sp. Ce105]MDM3290189.1 ead/Ea22-like family protein [Citrobacter sp. Ce105]